MMHHFFKHLSIEPALLFFYSNFLILDLINTNLYIQKVCRFNISVEPDLHTECDDLKQGILFASIINSNYKYFMLTMQIIFSILITSWSDEAGKRRKPLLFLPIIGQILQSLNGCMHSYFWKWSPLLAALTDMLTEVSTGGVILWLIGCQIYICDISDKDSVTMRLGMLLAVRTICVSIANGSSGFLIHELGFFYSYAICAGLALITLVLTLEFFKDVSVPIEKKRFCVIFNFMQILQNFKVVFKNSFGSYKKSLIFILLVVYVFIYFTIQGEKTVFYLFLRQKFHWNEVQYGIYMTYKNTGMILGTLFSSIGLSKWLKVHDGLIGAFASFWDTLAVIGYLFAYKDWHLYVVPIFDIFQGTALAVSVSFLSKFYESNEFGRLNSVLMMFSLLIPFCHPVYNIVFQKTLDSFPSAFFLISIMLNFIVFILYSISYIISKKIGT